MEAVNYTKKRYKRHGPHRRDHRDDRNSSAQPMGNKHRHRLKADDVKLIDALDNVMIAIRASDNLNKIINAKVIRKSVQTVVEEVIGKDNES